MKVKFKNYILFKVQVHGTIRHSNSALREDRIYSGNPEDVYVPFPVYMLPEVFLGYDVNSYKDEIINNLKTAVREVTPSMVNITLMDILEVDVYDKAIKVKELKPILREYVGKTIPFEGIYTTEYLYLTYKVAFKNKPEVPEFIRKGLSDKNFTTIAKVVNPYGYETNTEEFITFATPILKRTINGFVMDVMSTYDTVNYKYDLKPLEDREGNVIIEDLTKGILFATMIKNIQS